MFKGGEFGAVVRCIEIIGEAVKNITETLRIIR